MAINRSNGSITGVKNKPSGGGNVVTTIRASGNFNVQPGTNEVDVLVIAGGGGSGGDQGAGGGGAGGFQNLTNQLVAPGTTIPVTVGAGGAAGGTGTPEDGSDGGNSVFNNPTNVITSVGGGGGGLGDSQGGGTGRDGGSGGGGGGRGDDAGGSATSGQGNAGGKSKPQTSPTNDRGGGGGGAGGAGGDGANDPGAGGAGGIGAPSTITGFSKLYAGGGGGGSESSGGASGGANSQGGGGEGGNGAAGEAGRLSSGSGGGASGAAPAAGGAGASGIVIVKEKDKAGGMFNMNSQYNAVKVGQWPTVGRYQINNSCRFDGSSDYLHFTPSAVGDRRRFTVSTWIKFGDINNDSSADVIFSVTNTGYIIIRFEDKQLDYLDYDGSDVKSLSSDQLFRDVSAWQHIVVAVDMTLDNESTNSAKVKLYVNGEYLSPLFGLATVQFQPINQDTVVNTTAEHRIGRESGNYFSGYMADFYFIDGEQLDCGHFGEPDPDNDNIWIPKKYHGTFGSNGYFLEFKNAASMGTDTSGNGNTNTLVNIGSGNQTTDTPTLNYATINSQSTRSGSTFTEGNLATNTDDNKNDIATMGFANGKWYFEVKCAGSGIVGVGHESVEHLLGTNMNDDVGSVALSTYHGTIFHNNNQDTTPGTDTNGSIIGCAVDMDNNKIYWHNDGTYYSTSGGTQNPATAANPITIATGTPLTLGGFWFPKISSGTGSQTFEINFGNPTFSISSGNTDDNGYGNFEYDVPSGYYAINSKNLAQYG